MDSLIRSLERNLTLSGMVLDRPSKCTKHIVTALVETERNWVNCWPSPRRSWSGAGHSPILPSPVFRSDPFPLFLSLFSFPLILSLPLLFTHLLSRFNGSCLADRFLFCQVLNLTSYRTGPPIRRRKALHVPHTPRIFTFIILLWHFICFRKTAGNSTRSAVLALGLDMKAAADAIATALQPPVPNPAPAQLSQWRTKVLKLLLLENDPTNKTALRFIAYKLPSDLIDVIENYIDNYEANGMTYADLIAEFVAIKELWS